LSSSSAALNFFRQKPLDKRALFTLESRMFLPRRRARKTGVHRSDLTVASENYRRGEDTEIH